MVVASVITGDQGRSRRAAHPRSTTRPRILHASLQLIATRGFDGTDIVDIEEAVGLTPGSGGFYRHFKNKEDVLRAAIEAEIARVQAHHRMLAEREPATESGFNLTARVELMLEMLWETRYLMAVIARDSARFPDLVTEIAAAMADGGVSIDANDLERLMDAGSIMSRPANVVATIMMMAGVGYTLGESLLGGPVAGIDRDEFGRVLADLVIGRASS